MLGIHGFVCRKCFRRTAFLLLCLNRYWSASMMVDDVLVFYVRFRSHSFDRAHVHDDLEVLYATKPNCLWSYICYLSSLMEKYSGSIGISSVLLGLEYKCCRSVLTASCFHIFLNALYNYRSFLYDHYRYFFTNPYVCKMKACFLKLSLVQMKHQ